MKALPINALKQCILKQASEDVEFRQHLYTVLVGIFGDQTRQYVKDFSRTNRAVVVSTVTKAFAQELFLKRDRIKTELGKEYQELELVIR